MPAVLQPVLLAFAIAFLAVLIAAARKPSIGRTARSIDIHAPPERIFPHIANLQAMNVWNPFTKTDPNMKGVYVGPAHGVGAAFEFDGNRNAGAGRIEVKESVRPSRVRMNLVMTRPFACDNVVEFTLEPKAVPDSGTTTVTWAMTGPAPYLMRVLSTIVKMERMMHATFDKGLMSLKTIVENEDAQD